MPSKNRALSLFCVYGPLKKSEKTNEPIPRKKCYEQPDEQTNERMRIHQDLSAKRRSN